MVTDPAHPDIRLSLPGVAAYARFLMDRHLQDYARSCMEAFTAHNIDINTYFLPDETKTVTEQFIHAAARYLQLLADDKAGDQIAATLERLFPDVQETVDELQARSAFIFQLSYIHKKALKEFLPLYTGSVPEAMAIISEIDRYSLVFEEATNARCLYHIVRLLQLREEQLLEAQQLSGTGSYIWYLEQDQGYGTPELLRMLQLQSSADIRQHLDAIHQEDIGGVRRTMLSAIEHLSGYELRYRFMSSRGERVILTKGKVEHSAGGRQIKGTVMDITDVERMVHRLEESRRLYREAQELARIGNWSWDTEKNRVQWSDEVYHICDVHPAADGQQPDLLKTFGSNKDWLGVERQLARMRKTGRPIFYIGSIRLRDGREKILEIKGKAVQGGSGQPRQVIGTIQDVTNEQGLIRRLQDTERRYRHMEAIAHIGNWIINLDKNTAEVTDEFLRIYGLDPAQGTPDMAAIRAFLKAADRAELDVLIEECKRHGTPYVYECSIVSASGEEKMLYVRGEAIRDPDGRIYAIAGTLQDITRERRLVAQLQRSEALYKQAQTIGKIGNWVYDIALGRYEWSDELYHIYQMSPADASTLEKARDMILQPDRSLLDAHFMRCMEHGQPFDCHYRIVMPDGQIKHLRSKGEVAPYTGARAEQLIGTVQDVTEQRMVEKQLREHQRFTQKITDIAPSVIGVYNINTGRYEFISLAIEKILGYSREEVMAEGVAFFMRIIHPDDLPRLMAENTAAIADANDLQQGPHQDEIVEFKYRVRHRDGGWRWFQTFGTVFERNEAGAVEQVLNISLDISGEKQAELDLSHKNMLLQQSNTSLEEFAYIASHDLQEPLRKISTFGNMLETLQEEALSESGKLYLRKIVDSAIRMQQMISDVLSISIISGNRQFKRTSLQALLDEVLVTLEYKIEQTGTAILVAEPLPEAQVVPAQFRQLFQNLIGNSLKFLRPGIAPVITISYHYLTGEAVYQLGLDEHQRYLQLIFEDNGIGFSNHYAAKIFAIFQRLHGKSEYEGTGIGLAVCRKIAEHHNGMISAHGEPGKGATFTLVIPA